MLGKQHCRLNDSAVPALVSLEEAITESRMIDQVDSYSCCVLREVTNLGNKSLQIWVSPDDIRKIDVKRDDREGDDGHVVLISFED